jgi:hypothetical protein
MKRIYSWVDATVYFPSDWTIIRICAWEHKRLGAIYASDLDYSDGQHMLLIKWK